ncbi:MAG: YicC/YloC family endoribonuclease [Bacteroidota bacterium]
MIISMTGYGSATRSSENYKVTVELKSLNSKYLEATMKLSRAYLKYEHKLRNILTRELVRGKVMVILNVEILKADKRTLNINRALAKKYVTELREISAELGINSDISWDMLMELPEVIPTDQEIADPEEWALIEEAVRGACKELTKSRTVEGEALDRDLMARVTAIQSNLDEIKELAPKRLQNVRSRIDQALEDIRHKVEDLDKNRFEQEIIYYLEKLDINEEIVRLSQHLIYFSEMRGNDTSNGKQLQFIGQEMGREINTIGSKANDPQIQRRVVRMKDELEKIKEQVLNVV